MSIPACTASHLVAGLGLVPADGILDGTAHHVVDAGHTVGGRRSFEENELRCSFTEFQRFLEGGIFLPALQHTVVNPHKVKPFIFLEFHLYSISYVSLCAMRRNRNCKYKDFY